ncbi:MAG: DUF456 domain-containing protein [Holophagaceae bacterium]|nr:DUF456 domain-containing protein [Holophagaceae bacterium]
MPWTVSLGWILGGLLLLIGFLGAWLPVLPGLPVMVLGALAVKLLVPGALSWWTIAVFAVTALVALGLDALATAFTSRLAGASRKGIAGALVGGFLGLFFGLPGILFGPFLGAVVAELAFARRPVAEALKAGLGAAVGFLAGTIGKGLLGLFLLVWFFADAFVF